MNYTVAVSRQFIAQHFLIGGDWGVEGCLHSHHYRLELQISGNQLDEHGFLVDIQKIEEILDVIVNNYRDRTLNTLPSFVDLNPSLERFAQLICKDVIGLFVADNWTQLNIKLWENDSAWAMVSEINQRKPKRRFICVLD